MKRFVIFLPGTYRRMHLKFYRGLCRKARLVAVDGGCRFFVAAGMTPDVIIGDLDSVTSIPSQFREQSQLLLYPRDKNKTDLQLALEYCVKERARVVDVVSPGVGEVDHFLGNVMLLGLFDKMSGVSTKPKIRIVSADYEILWVHDDRRPFSGCVGDRLSVVPVSATIRLTCRGTEFAVDRLRIVRGHSHGLRNRITRRRASVGIEGKALVVHRLSHPK
jgi:thiamine pyrophosphokinase